MPRILGTTRLHLALALAAALTGTLTGTTSGVLVAAVVVVVVALRVWVRAELASSSFTGYPVKLALPVRNFMREA
ncbi:hypothetical protein [Nocardioides sp. cx-173]|uniref:hypothetical protein n=1 Tax=Nocardioides sp. cx-173 TaxID=2898796 RepID=UPI001E51B447|nr:hypothetical protein [Nocardioides sp. cx-173]MCD4523542.1 hypothetical protein [Nocardioides sp. cx-173]UGB42120.1 hypothetical protein LQ940_01000 [Nocardioides sp. cx-173]